MHSLNPKQMDRFGDRFTVAGSKDDRFDARVIADSLRTDTRCFRRLSIDQPELVELREWSRMADELRQERDRLANRIREQLRRYYPQMLKLGADVTAPWFLALWSRLPTPTKAKRIHEGTVARILKQHRIRKWNAAEVLEVLRERPVTVIAGTTDAAVAHLEQLVARVRLVNEQLAQARRRIDALRDAVAEAPPAQGDPEQRIEQRDVELLRSVPGVGRMVLAALLAEASQALAARDDHALRALAGVAPVTRSSGKRKGKRSIQVCARPAPIGYGPRFTTSPGWRRSTTARAARETRPCARRGTATGALPDCLTRVGREGTNRLLNDADAQPGSRVHSAARA